MRKFKWGDRVRYKVGGRTGVIDYCDETWKYSLNPVVGFRPDDNPLSFSNVYEDAFELVEEPMNSTNYNPRKTSSPEYSMPLKEVMEYGRKMHEELAKQYASPPTPIRAPVNCAICNKEYSGPEQVNNNVGASSIVGGACIVSPMPKTGGMYVRAQEALIIGPCCARKVDAFIMDLKTKTNVTTTRENATNSWMPHDEDGCL